jgi:tRNA(Ile)-lysidine synthase TilS/MesJ
LSILLRDLGYNVVPVIVDLGYANFPSSKIAAAAQALGFDPTVIRTRDAPYLSNLDQEKRERVQRNFAAIDDPGCQTPCGPCSQVKRISLQQFCQITHSAWVALGHHREDSIATVLKDYFVATYYREVGRFEPSLFAKFLTNAPIDIQLLRDLVNQGLAATMGVRLRLDKRTTLFRPMAYVPERDIQHLRDNLSLATFGSGCAHEVFSHGIQSPVTKREMVLHELRKRLHCDPNLGDELLSAALESLTIDGLPKSDPRKERVARFPGFDDE